MNIAAFFDEHPAVAVALSGGVDSAVLLALACEHAKRVRAYYIQTPFQPAFEAQDAKRIADTLGVNLTVSKVNILTDKAVVANPANRCYYCKKRIFTEICKRALADGFTTVLDGTNASDDADDRPGMRALCELEVLSPLRLCGYTKAEVRNIARQKGLSVSDKPSYACLATRIPTGTEITAELLNITEEAEDGLRAMGFRNFRVRYLDGAAKLQLSRQDFSLLFDKKTQVQEFLGQYYREVLLDLKARPDDD